MNTAEWRRVGNRTTTRSAMTRLRNQTRSLRQDQRDSRGDLHLAEDEADARNGDQVSVAGAVDTGGRARAPRERTGNVGSGSWHWHLLFERCRAKRGGAPYEGR